MTVFDEFVKTLFCWRIWLLLGFQDIKIRYSRSSLGPLWITLSMCVTIYTMGFLYGHLFKVNLTDYLPYLASGIICWGFISTLLMEGPNLFIEAEGYIRNIKLPYLVFVMKLVMRNLIIFAHNILAFVPIYLFFPVKPTLYTLMIFPGMLVILINAVFFDAIIGILGTRFRDFPQIVVSLVQVIFFLTPIMWMPSLLPANYHIFFDYNPFNQFINLLRSPLLNQPIALKTLFVTGIATAINFFLFVKIFHKHQKRIVFWL